MQENNNFQQRYEDDEIDLIELFKRKFGRQEKQ